MSTSPALNVAWWLALRIAVGRPPPLEPYLELLAWSALHGARA